jgi:signal transduction histidine kinase
MIRPSLQGVPVDLTKELHATLVFGALLLAASALARGTNVLAGRLFALLCLAVATWNAGVWLRLEHLAPGFPWWWVIMLGALAAVAVGVHLATVLTGDRGRARRRFVPTVYAVCGLLWLSVLHPETDRHWNEWRVGALGLLAAILGAALWLLWRHLRTLTHEPQRGAFRILFGGAVVAVVGGLSDLIPRDDDTIPRIGPAAVLLLLLVICALVVRYQFFDVDNFLARVVGIVLGAAAATALLYTVVTLTRARPFPLFAAILLLVALSWPLARVLTSGRLGLFAPGEPIAKVLAAASAQLASARDAGEAWRAIEQGRRVLPGGTRLAIHLPGEEGILERAATRAALILPTMAQGEPVLRWLAGQAAPAPRSKVLRAAAEGEPDRELAAGALATVDSLDLDLLVPLSRGATVVGWFGLGGGRTEDYLRPEVATALLALGHQARTTFDRLGTEARARRQAAFAALGEVAGGLAHEIRNPVAAIRGAADVLANETRPAAVREMLDVIREESMRLGRVLEEFSDFARPLERRREPVDVAALLRATIRQAELAGLGMNVTLAVGAAVPPVPADADQLQRALANLVRNAREAAGATGRLEVDVTRQGDHVAIRFADDGPGLPPGTPEKLFEPFRTTKKGGLGLGLALVQRVVDAHGGEIRVERLPRGTAFTIVLPAAPEPREAERAPPPAEQEAGR